MSPVRSFQWDPRQPRLAICTGGSKVYLWSPAGCVSVQVPGEGKHKPAHGDTEAQHMLASDRLICLSLLTCVMSMWKMPPLLLWDPAERVCLTGICCPKPSWLCLQPWHHQTLLTPQLPSHRSWFLTLWPPVSLGDFPVLGLCWHLSGDSLALLSKDHFCLCFLETKERVGTAYGQRDGLSRT